MFDELLICHEMREQKFVDKLAEEAVVLESWRIDVWRPRGPLPRQDPPDFPICEILVQLYSLIVVYLSYPLLLPVDQRE